MDVQTKSPWLKLAVLALVLVVAFVSCDKSFDARGTFDSEMVVFAVFSTDRTNQIVRVQQSYMPASYDPLSYTTENSLVDAIVSLNSTSGSQQMRDTLVPYSDTSRYKIPTHAFVLDPFTPEFGATYEVVVQSIHHGVASSSVVIPGQSVITIDPIQLHTMDHTETYSQGSPITFVVKLSDNADGYVCKLFLYYDVLKGTKWFEERVEVPITSADPKNYTLDYPVYPRLQKAPKTVKIGANYLNGYFRGTVSTINSRYHSRLIFKWATFVVLQADKNLFKYYVTTHPDQDPYSMRLDEPQYSAIDGGLGVVGAYSLDSLVDLLPGNFWGNR